MVKTSDEAATGHCFRFEFYSNESGVVYQADTCSEKLKKKSRTTSILPERTFYQPCTRERTLTYIQHCSVYVAPALKTIYFIKI